MIELENVTKIYEMGNQQVAALGGVSLSIDEGEIVAIMGRSGSGKSTMMNLIGCLDVPTSGRYVLDGEDVGRLSDDRLAAVRNRKIGFVFQTFNLLPRLSALENVALPLVYAGKNKVDRLQKAEQMMERVGLGDRMNHKPNELSGGQGQRVAIARAMINDPSIILADEPTGNLDSKTSQEIMELFRQIHEDGNTVIVVTHEADIAKHARRIIRLMDGLVESDNLNEVKEVSSE